MLKVHYRFYNFLLLQHFKILWKQGKCLKLTSLWLLGCTEQLLNTFLTETLSSGTKQAQISLIHQTDRDKVEWEHIDPLNSSVSMKGCITGSDLGKLKRAPDQSAAQFPHRAHLWHQWQILGVWEVNMVHSSDLITSLVSDYDRFFWRCYY